MSTDRLTRARFGDAVDRLAPAEAATHWDHPNLWSWRELLAGAGDASTFVAFFVGEVGDEPVDDLDRRFRTQLSAR